MTIDDLAVQMETRIDLRARRAVGIDHPTDLFTRVIGRALKPGNSGNNTANQVYHATRTLAGSAAEILSLNGTTSEAVQLRNAFGDIISFTSISLVVIKAGSAELWIGGSQFQPWAPMFPASVTDRIAVVPGATKVLYNPGVTWPVTFDHCKLRIENRGGAETNYEIIIVGKAVDLIEDQDQETLYVFAPTSPKVVTETSEQLVAYNPDRYPGFTLGDEVIWEMWGTIVGNGAADCTVRLVKVSGIDAPGPDDPSNPAAQHDEWANYQFVNPTANSTFWHIRWRSVQYVVTDFGDLQFNITVRAYDLITGLPVIDYTASTTKTPLHNVFTGWFQIRALWSAGGGTLTVGGSTIKTTKRTAALI